MWKLSFQMSLKFDFLVKELKLARGRQLVLVAPPSPSEINLLIPLVYEFISYETLCFVFLKSKECQSALVLIESCLGRRAGGHWDDAMPSKVRPN